MALPIPKRNDYSSLAAYQSALQKYRASLSAPVSNTSSSQRTLSTPAGMYDPGDPISNKLATRSLNLQQPAVAAETIDFNAPAYVETPMGTFTVFKGKGLGESVAKQIQNAAATYGIPFDQKDLLTIQNNSNYGKGDASEVLRRIGEQVSIAYSSGKQATPNIETTVGDTSANIRINTGIPAVDQVANAFLDAIWGQYSQYFSNIPQGIDDTLMTELEAQIEKEFGPSLTRMKQSAQDAYDMSLKITRGQQDVVNKQYSNQLNRGAYDTAVSMGRVKEDTAQQQKVLGRSYQEAMRDMQTNYSLAGTTFSGERARQEELMKTKEAEDMGLLSTTAGRQLTDLQLQQQRLGEDVDLGRTSSNLATEGNMFNIENTYKDALQQLTDYKANLLNNRAQTVQNLPFQILPSMLNQPTFANVTNNPVITSTASTSRTSTPTTRTTLPTVKTYAAGDTYQGRTLNPTTAANVNKQLAQLNKTSSGRKLIASNSLKTW